MKVLLREVLVQFFVGFGVYGICGRWVYICGGGGSVGGEGDLTEDCGWVKYLLAASGE